jgi:hypothetical protein
MTQHKDRFCLSAKPKPYGAELHRPARVFQLSVQFQCEMLSDRQIFSGLYSRSDKKRTAVFMYSTRHIHQTVTKLEFFDK